MTFNSEISSLKPDLVVIGGGGAGLAAAISAAEAGCKNIIVLEKLNVIGGNFNINGGIFAADSPVQKRAKFLNASRDYFFNTVMRWSHWKIDAEMIRAVIDKSGDTIAVNNLLPFPGAEGQGQW